MHERKNRPFCEDLCQMPSEPSLLPNQVGLLQPLPIPPGPLHSLTMNFIAGVTMLRCHLVDGGSVKLIGAYGANHRNKNCFGDRSSSMHGGSIIGCQK